MIKSKEITFDWFLDKLKEQSNVDKVIISANVLNILEDTNNSLLNKLYDEAYKIKQNMKETEPEVFIKAIMLADSYRNTENYIERLEAYLKELIK